MATKCVCDRCNNDCRQGALVTPVTIDGWKDGVRQASVTVVVELYGKGAPVDLCYVCFVDVLLEVAKTLSKEFYGASSDEAGQGDIQEGAAAAEPDASDR